MDRNEINDTLTAAQTYLTSLRKLNEQIETAEEQIKTTSEETYRNVETTFEKLLQDVTGILKQRKEKLLEQSKSIKNEAVKPLEDCHKVISEKIGETLKLITTGERLLEANDSIGEFQSKSALLGSLPEVPALNEVPHVSFQFASTTEQDIRELCSQFGAVSRIAPAQINSLTERPGAILVEWRCVELEDVQEFRLQRAFGDVLTNKHLLANFMDCYTGLETHFLVRDLQVDQAYSFRVCCRFEGRLERSPWSLLQVFSTLIPAFSWMDNADYLMSDENKICKAKIDKPSVLFSNGPQFKVGYSVEFTFLEIDAKTDSILGLILIDDTKKVHSLKEDANNSFLIDSKGEIYINSVKKSTKLPELTKGLKVCFTCYPVNDNKIRINVDSCDKIVTYDWAVPKDTNLYFAAWFESAHSKIMVE